VLLLLLAERAHPFGVLLGLAEAVTGSTSEPQDGQWYVPSGRRLISGWPHSQGCSPKTSGTSVICRRVFSIAPLKCPPHDPQRIESLPKGRSPSTSQRGHTKESGLDVEDEAFNSRPFLMVMAYSEGTATRSTDDSTLVQAEPMQPREELGP
jgi:hypothetical protein